MNETFDGIFGGQNGEVITLHNSGGQVKYPVVIIYDKNGNLLKIDCHADAKEAA